MESERGLTGAKPTVGLTKRGPNAEVANPCAGLAGTGRNRRRKTFLPCNRWMRKTARPVVWEVAGTQSPAPDPLIRQTCRSHSSIGIRATEETVGETTEWRRVFAGCVRFSLSPAEGERAGVRGKTTAVIDAIRIRHCRSPPHPDPLPFRRGEGIGRGTVVYPTPSSVIHGPSLLSLERRPFWGARLK